jgi:outer membrane protein TolC
MKPARQLLLWAVVALLISSSSFSLASDTPAQGGPLTLKQAVELALVHSPVAGQVAADQQRAFASFREARNQYIPQVIVGSGLGGTWGYPLALEGSAPSLFNVTAQSALFNPALRDSIRAARREYEATESGSQDRHNQIIQDTVLTYLELLKWQELSDHMRQQHEDAVRQEQVVEQRIAAGVGSPQMRIQAKLVSARANLHIEQAQGALDTLRANLSQLTGVPANAIETVADSVPAFPETPSSEDTEAVAEASPAVQFARQHALALGFRARAEHRALWPSVDFATQYAVLAKFNNWLQFFPTKAFERNNATVGVVIRFPFFNASQHAHADAADAEASHANKEVQSTKNQVSQEILKLQHSVRQLAAAREVSDLEYQIAKSNLDNIQVHLTSGGATVLDEAHASTDVSEKYNALQDADFEVTRARIGLLRASGDLEKWLSQGK